MPKYISKFLPRLLVTVVAFFLLAFIPFSNSTYAAPQTSSMPDLTGDGEFTIDDIIFDAYVEDDMLNIDVCLTEDNPGIAMVDLNLVWGEDRDSFTIDTKNLANYITGGDLLPSSSGGYFRYDGNSARDWFYSYDNDFINSSSGAGIFATFKYDISGDLPDGPYQVKVQNIFICNDTETISLSANPTDQYIDFTVARQEAGIPVESIELDKETASVPLGGSLNLNANVLPEDAANKLLRWSSSDSAIATVAGGVVTPKTVGTTTITATAQDGSGVFASCEVTVYRPVTAVALCTKDPAGGLTPRPDLGEFDPLVLAAGSTGEVFPYVYPVEAADKSVSITSGDESVATATFEDGRWMVDAVSSGWTELTATTTDGGFSSSVMVVVEAADAAQKPAASIGDVEYDTLEEAFEAGQDGDTIVLLKDQFYQKTLRINSSCSLDFNGYTLYVASMFTVGAPRTSANLEPAAITQISNGTLVTFGSNGLISGGTLTIAEGYVIEKLSDMTIYGGVSLGSDSAIQMIEDCTISNGLTIPQDAVVSGIYGNSTITGNPAVHLAGYTTGGTANIYDGTFIGAMRAGTVGDAYAELNVYGGRFDTYFPSSKNIHFGEGLRLSPEPYEDGYYHVEEYEALGTATFTLLTQGSAMVLKDTNGDEVSPDSTTDGAWTYTLPWKKTFTFTVSAEGYSPKSGSLTMNKLALNMEVSLDADGEQTREVAIGDAIVFGGTYRVLNPNAGSSGHHANYVSGSIGIQTTEPVTLLGTGISATEGDMIEGVTFDCIEGAQVTIQDLWVSNTSGGFNFTGADNTLTVTGENILEVMSYATTGFIHVAKGSELVIDGDGTLYGYKYSSGAGIGGGANEPSGKITFNVAHLYIKGSKTGPLIGGDGGMTPSTQGIANDLITIAGGEVVLVNKAAGDAIGDGHASTSAGPVKLTGGNLTIITDFSGDAIGNRGSFTMTGGSFRAVRTGNSLWTDYTEAYQVLDYSRVTENRLTADGEPAYVLAFDTAQLSEAADTFDVRIDGVPFYSGGLHRFYYGPSTEYTPDNFDVATPESMFASIHGSGTYYDTNLYFLVSEGTHELMVNGEKFDVTWNSADARYADSFTVTATELDPLEVGDFDGDGGVTASDALRVARAVISGPGNATPAQLTAADMDGDGVLTMADVVRILRKAAGLP